jgi:cytochrome c oxidase subunit II
MRAPLAAALAAAAVALASIALAGGIGTGVGREAEPSATAPRATSVEQSSGRAVFARMGCGTCHTLAAAGSAGTIGPNLDERLGPHTRASLVERITRPPSSEDFSAMPTDFGSRLNGRELDALVRFLLAARGTR